MEVFFVWFYGGFGWGGAGWRKEAKGRGLGVGECRSWGIPFALGVVVV